MGLLDLLLVAVGLSMDAFAVSVCKGLNTKKQEYILADSRRLCLHSDISEAEQFASTLKRSGFQICCTVSSVHNRYQHDS